MRFRTILAGVAIVAAATAGIAIYLSSRHSAPANVAGAYPGQLAPNFSAPTMDGALQLSSLQGRPVVLGFVQSDCGSCAGTLRSFSSLASGSKARFVAINMPGGGTAADLSGFGKLLGVSGVAYAADPTGTVSQRFRITEVDTVFVLSSSGRVVWRGVSPSDQQLAGAIRLA
jgi:peroxiredoxin